MKNFWTVLIRGALVLGMGFIFGLGTQGAHAQDSSSVAYFSLQHAEDWPPLPANLWGLPEI